MKFKLEHFELTAIVLKIKYKKKRQKEDKNVFCETFHTELFELRCSQYLCLIPLEKFLT